MGNCLAGICGGSQPKKLQDQPVVACSIAGYDWDPNAVEPEKPSVIVPVPKAASVPASEPAPAPAAEPDCWASVPRPEPEEPAAPPKPAPTTPITLDTLQGDWVNSVGAKISVSGTEVTLNGVLMKMHPVLLEEDGTVKSVGRIWQLWGWLEDEKIEFKEAPSKEAATYARSVIWSQATTDRMKQWNTQMANLGYAGSSKQPLNRGVEGCAPGTCDAAARIVADDKDKDKAELRLLNKLITDYRHPGMKKVPPRRVIPDFSNRGHTGLSVEHVHYLATSFKEKGFQRRRGNEGHDIPVLVQESTTSDLGSKSIQNWREKLEHEPGFPPKEHYERVFAQSELYTSLGNGHFNQALNLFACECDSIYGNRKYTVGSDAALREAVFQGVDAIILRGDIPLRDRETISKLLNSKREYKWNVYDNGTIDISDATEDMRTCKQFEALSKVLDAVELNCLVRSELGVSDSSRVGQ